MQNLEENKIKQPDQLVNDAPTGTGVNSSANKVYLSVVGACFLLLTVVFVFFPRTRYSELEKRDLADFPSSELFFDDPASFTAAISQWFSDSEPYRDEFMTLSMYIRDALKFRTGNADEAITFIPAVEQPVAATPEKDSVNDPDTTRTVADENAKIANAGIIVLGSDENVRALMAFGGTPSSAMPFVNMVNRYAAEFPGIRVYAMPIPTATEFYLPEKVSKASRPQKPVIDQVASGVGAGRFVDAYSALSAHTDQNIYLRTDHHWAPLGAYYAAKALAATAGVPFRDLGNYTEKTVHRFVGSMYGYSKDVSVKNAPEDFVYYVPNGLAYKTTFISFNLDKNFKITSASKPYDGQFFRHYKDGSGAAYNTFMGGDSHIVKIKTGTPGTRRLLIIKDSYGNPVPSFLFYSFGEIHIVDFRYFNDNMKDYVSRNNITDIVMAFNVFNVCTSSVARKVANFLTQTPGDYAQSMPVSENDSVPDVKTTEAETVSGNTPEIETEATNAEPDNKGPEN